MKEPEKEPNLGAIFPIVTIQHQGLFWFPEVMTNEISHCIIDSTPGMPLIK